MTREMKKVARIYSKPSTHMVGDGFRVRNYIPGRHDLMDLANPFIMLDYNTPHIFEDNGKRRGVDAHPHKGFETVTIVYDGEVEHRDSTGAGGKIGPGEVQWMTAGAGLIHEEYHGEDFAKAGGSFHMVQLWVNLPAKDKLTPPSYQALTAENIPSVMLAEGQGSVRVIAGEYGNIKGAAKTFSPVHIYDVTLKAGAMAEFDFTEDFVTFILVNTGKIVIGGVEEAGEAEFVEFGRGGQEFKVEASEDSRFLLLSAEPLNEPIASYGPFVMNTHQEIVETIKEYNEGKFGMIG